MKRISLILASLALLFSTKASAAVGGPFDNGDYSALLDNGGVYQVSFRFSNGSGFAQFGTNVDVALFLDVSSATSFARGSTYSYLNRSILYYKGVSYLGTCTGMVDHEARYVQGVTNANSDVSTTASTSGVGGGVNTGAATTSATTSLQNNGGASLTCNTNWRCKITKTYPILRFSGEGELSVLNPSLGQITLQGIAAIINDDSSGGGGTIVIDPPTIGEQIGDLLNAVAANQAAIQSIIPTAEQIRDNSDHVPLKAFGSRQFFVGRR